MVSVLKGLTSRRKAWTHTVTRHYTKAMGLSTQLPRRQCFSWDLRKGQNFTELVQVLVKKWVGGFQAV